MLKDVGDVEIVGVTNEMPRVCWCLGLCGAPHVYMGFGRHRKTNQTGKVTLAGSDKLTTSKTYMQRFGGNG